MTESNQQAAADLLLAARADPARRLAALPEALRPADQAAAYAIQRCVMAQLGLIGGWKVGAANPQAAPICGPMPASRIALQPITLRLAPGYDRGVEAEMAFRMKADLPPRGIDYTRDEVIAAIASAHPAIEWLQPRFRDADAVDPLSHLADTQSHGGFVYGEAVHGWHSIDFTAETVTQAVGDEPAVTRTGNPGGEMIRLVAWLANVGAAWAGGLRAGQFVTCGSWTGKTMVSAGQHVAVGFPSLGRVELTA